MRTLRSIWQEVDLKVLAQEMAKEVAEKGLTPLATVLIQRVYKLTGLEHPTTWISAIDALIKEEGLTPELGQSAI